MTSIAVLVACHNRVNSTVRALESLRSGMSNAQAADLQIFLVDDGSTDDTSEVIRRRFPDVSVIVGSGNLFWNGGMVAAFQASRATQQKFDAYLLFNDDVVLDEAVIPSFIDAYTTINRERNSILVGATRASSDGADVTYAGFDVGSKLRPMSFNFVKPDAGGQLRPCDTFNANFVMIPGETMRQLNGLDARYQHGLGDLDFGLDAKRHGVDSFVFSTIIGVCDKGPPISKRISKLPRRDRARAIFIHPYGIKPYLVFCSKHKPKWLLPLYAVRFVLVRLGMLIKA